jgi:hypothetical protein
MESKNIGFPYNLATALDCAIRDFEVEKDTKKYGYKVKDNIYYNYMSNEYWESYKKDMPEEHRKQFDNGSGGELKEKKGRWGIYPPKMASFGSSSRMIYELSKDIPGFCFEEQLDTRVGGIANLDGFLKKDNKYIYIEAKRREIYSSTHESEEIKEVYLPVYEWVEDKCGKEYFSFTKADAKEEGIKKVTFYLNNNPVQYFDLKQLICHFLGITYDIAKYNIKDAKVKFVYLIYNPEEVEGIISKKYKDNIVTRYREVTEFVNKNTDIIKSIFNAVFKYQTKRHNLPDTDVNLEFKLVDQDTYKGELK